MSELVKTREIPGAALIRTVQGAEETPHDRLIRKHVPAWVVSGAIHVVLLAVCIMLGRMSLATARPSAEIIQAIVDPAQDQEEQQNLTNPDIGLESNLKATADTVREADVTVQTKDTSDGPIGMAPAESTVPLDTATLAGTGSGKDLGVAGPNGAFATGSGGEGGISMAPGFLGRTAASREQLAKLGGGNAESEAAVAKGLIWLARQQRADGSWTYDDGAAKEDTCSATALALLPFLAAGQTHIPGKGNTYQQTVLKGLNYLISLQNPASGSFRKASPQYMYAHAIAAVALCELYGMTGDKAKVLYPAKAAINFIVKAQGANGSWGYTANTEGDTSIVGWQIQALRSAEMCKDIPFPKTAYEKAIKFLDSVSGGGSAKSTYGYRDGPGQPGTALTAVGLLCRYYISGWGPIHPGLVEGVDGLLKRNPPNPARFNVYYFYYATQVVHFHEGDAWFKEWNPKMRDLLVKLQVGPEKGPKLAGSWDKDQGMMGASTGRLGTTCLALLTLEVYYRHLPLYKRHADANVVEMAK